MNTSIETQEFSSADQLAMDEALNLATRSVGLSDPNPRVGCVICSSDGRIIGQGFTQRAGEAHAEIVALQDSVSRNEDIAGATAYVTLEPCAHHGKTPPCCDALAKSGIARVVIAIQDPNPLVSGKGIARLRAAGISVEVGLHEQRARDINVGFFSRFERGQPWVRIKGAISLDGRSALSNGASQWITCETSRMDGHRWRKRSGAVLTGSGTVLEDDPQLDVRLVKTAVQPLRVVVDSRLRVPANARLFNGIGKVVIYTAVNDPVAAGCLAERGAEVIIAPTKDGNVDLKAVLHDLAERGVNEVLVEAGSVLTGSFIRESLVDEYVIYIAPMLLGEGLNFAEIGTLEQIGDGERLHIHDVSLTGSDICVLAHATKNRKSF